VGSVAYRSRSNNLVILEDTLTCIELRVTEVTKVIGQEWSAMSEEAKRVSFINI
jgi:hypothetical protein